MAKLKKTVMQRSFVYMDVREDFLEGDDLDLRNQSARSTLNMKSLASRTTEARPATFLVRGLPGADEIIELRPATGLRFGLVLKDTSFDILSEDGNVVFTQASVAWTDANNVWINHMRSKTIMGSGVDGLFVLEYASGTWTFGDFAFTETAGGELAQPYWAYDKTTVIQPDGLSGSVRVTASNPIWVDAYVGQRIRYGLREILITERISSTVLRGDVVNELPPSFRIRVGDTTEYRVGEAVVGADSNYQGLIISISGLDLYVVTQAFFEGPEAAEELSGPMGSSTIASVTSISPLESPIWDEPLMSPLRGYPRSSESVSSRIVFLDFEAVPDLIAISSARRIEDFKVGVEDDDAIVRQAGDGAPRWLNAVNMGDLLLLSDNGVYNVPTRDNGVLSPSTFNTVFIDEIGCSPIKPVKVGDGVVFVDSSEKNIAAILLDGNVYLKWSVKPLTTYHNHLIKSPQRLCGPSLGSEEAEKYLFVVNGDGTLAVMSWQQNIRDEAIGFTPWETQGQFVSVSPIFGGYWTIVDRSIDGSTERFLERFSNDAVLDCAAYGAELSSTTTLMVNGDDLEVNGADLTVGVPSAAHLSGEVVDYYIDGWDAGTFTVNSDGTIDDEPTVTGTRQVGFGFTAKLRPWPVEIMESDRVGSIKARVMEFIVSVQNSHGFDVVCNGVNHHVGAYSFGDDLSLPPPPKTMVRRFSIFGNRDHPDMEIIKTRPGKLRVLAIGQKVQA